MLVKRLVLVILLAIFYLSIYGQNMKVIVYADDGYPPYSYKEGDLAVGIYAEILQTAFSRMEGYDVEMKPIPWLRGLSMLESGEGFAIYPPYYRPKERPYMDYSVPILAEEMAVLVRKDLLPRKKWIDDYKGLTIGINRGFAVFSDDEKKLIKIEEEATNRGNLLKLGAKRIDAYANDRISMLWSLQQLKSSGEYRTNFVDVEIGTIIRTEYGYLGYTTSSGDKYSYKKDFMEKFDKEINKMKENGEIEAIVRRYTN